MPDLPYPEINAALNTGAALLLVCGFLLARAGNYRAHRWVMSTALALSCLFLLSYVAGKIASGGVHTPFHGTGLWRPIYFTLLLSHTILAAASVPLILWTFWLALSGRAQAHRRWARWVFPVWLYVSVTGVLIYVCLFSGSFQAATYPPDHPETLAVVRELGETPQAYR